MDGSGLDGSGRHLPYPAPIEAYGKGGFRFAGMSHRGSLLCLPGGIWASDVQAIGAVGPDEIAPVLAAAPPVTHFLIGSGTEQAVLPRFLRDAFRTHHVAVEVMTTGAAVRTYNILLAERRPVGALLIAVD